MANSFFKKYSALEIIYTVVAIAASMAIFQLDTTLNPYLEITTIIRVSLSYLLMLICLFPLLFRSVNQDQLRYLVIIFLWWFISVFHVAPGQEVNLNLLVMIILVVYSYFRPEERIRIFQLYRMYIVLMSICGIIAYAVHLLNLPFPCSIVKYYTGTEVRRHVYSWGYYYNYYLSAIWQSGQLSRLCGWFNEPGYFGTIAALVLIADNVNVKKWSNVVILMAAVCTFSLAAFFILLGYIVTVSIRKRKMIIGLAIFFMVVGVAVPIIFKDNPTFVKFTERFEFKDGKFKGDSRANNKIFIQLQEQQFNSVTATLFGKGNGALKQYGNLGILSMKVQVYLYGIVGVMLTYGLLLLLAWKVARGNWHAKCFVIWYFLSAYQRPYIFTGEYMLILFGGILWLRQTRPGKHDSNNNNDEDEDEEEEEDEDIEEIKGMELIGVPVENNEKNTVPDRVS